MEVTSFEEWIDAFIEFVSGMGYRGAIDKESLESDWEEGRDAFEVAREFVAEMNEE